ncbi:glycosyltransferase [Granulicella mallensis]|uniref:GT2 family glycosyltransferase n=1 Tax=Granulicella mallensis TaxID=940614 RepID=A0A7W7ZP58_9BACT|nr:glycosyltransferase [Granulicella mallensis]MBB5063621.1 GT2 family glycosyltransferase [Granulicella mallensis]
MRIADNDIQRPSASSLLAVVVVYKLCPSKSSTLQTLLATAKNVSSEELNLKIVVWDNTPGGQEIEKLPDGVSYVSAPENPGLALAYNHVLALAEAEGYEWLLTLDQDSLLPADFLKRISDLTCKLGPVEKIGAIVPQVIAGGRIMSPFHFIFKAIPRLFPRGFVGIWKGAVYAANSGAVLRVNAVREIGGYDLMFPLDLSDTSLFHRLHASGKQVFISGDLSMGHDFALHNKQTRMSIQRYDASLLDDCAFWDMYMGPLARFERVVRFSVRALKELFTPEAADFRRRTVLELRRRLFTTRKARIAAWRTWATRRRDESSASTHLQQRAI